MIAGRIAVIVLLGAKCAASADVQCGAYCLYVSLKAVGAPVGGMDELQKKLGPPDRSGYSLGRLQDVAAGYGASTMAVHTTLDRLQLRQRPLAVIAHLPEGHFVGLADVTAADVVIVDPPDIRTVSTSAFLSRWNGDALLVSMQPLKPEDSLRAPAGWRTWAGWTVLTAGLCAAAWAITVRFRRCRTALGIVTVLVTHGCAEQPAPVPVGRLRVAPREVDLGEVVLSSSGLAAQVTLENFGNGPLELSKIVTSCSCLVADAPPAKLQSGESAVVTLQVRPDQPGEGIKRAVILCNDPITPRVDVNVRWNAVPRVIADLPSVDFGLLRPAATAERRVRLTFKEPNLRLGPPELHSEGVLFAAVESFDDDGLLTLTVRAGNDPGTFSKSVRVPIEGCDAPPVKITADRQVRDVIAAVPPRCALGSAQVGTSIDRRIRLVSSTGPIVVDGVEVVGIPGCEATPAATSDGITIQIRWTPMQIGVQTGTLQVRCSRPEAVVLSIPMSGHASPSAGSETTGAQRESTP